jgi:hypothetical protein
MALSVSLALVSAADNIDVNADVSRFSFGAPLLWHSRGSWLFPMEKFPQKFNFLVG